MSRFLVLYRLAADAPDPMDQTDQAAIASGMRAWRDWFDLVGPGLLDAGGPTRPVAAGPVSDGRASDGSRVSGFSIVEAASPEALEVLLDAHPHRALGTFEVHAVAGPPAP